MVLATKCEHIDKKHEAFGLCKQCYTKLPHAKSQARRYRSENPERVHAWSRAGYLRNLQSNIDRSARWRKNNLERKRESSRAWGRRNRDKMIESNRMRVARQRNAPIIERIYRKKVWSLSDGTCHICLLPADLNNWHLEHVVPLIRGGNHTYENVRVSHPACNLRKGAKLLEELTK